MLGSPKVHALLGKRSKQANGKRFGVYAETRNEVQFATWLRMTELSIKSSLSRDKTANVMRFSFGRERRKQA